MKIIIPMAGHSRRFKSSGYDVPKPFINIDGKPMIEWVCRMFLPTDEFIFICDKEHLVNNEYRGLLKRLTEFYSIVEIGPHELGPVYSSLQAEPFIEDENEPVIISYCDFTMQWDYRKFLLNAARYEGAMPVFRGFHPASYGNTYYAYIKANSEMEMVELREKRPFTANREEEFASTGVYYLDSWKTFRHYASELLENHQEGASEYYCSLIYGPMVSDGKKISLFEVEKFICWGTPGDLEEYLFWSEYFSNDLNRIKLGASK
jgi:NDP-sugar pyrophosphorylase family protein